MAFSPPAPPPTTPALASLLEQLEAEAQAAVVICAELRAATAGSDIFSSVATLARLVESTHENIGTLRSAPDAADQRRLPVR